MNFSVKDTLNKTISSIIMVKVRLNTKKIEHNYNQEINLEKDVVEKKTAVISGDYFLK
ncbi:MAG: hypothetical protein LBT10_09250 [Methanobrevibacter sp.]|jgi:hypothetical protein|nr:hypothetical protein [Methanobrevibacter sp.]